MGLGKTYRLGGDFKVIIWGESTKNWEHFSWGELTLKTANKDFHLAVGGRLGWMKWSKNRAEKGFIFHAIIPALYPLW